MYISMFVVLSFLLSSPSLFRFFSDHNLGQFLRWSPYPVSTLVITIRSLKTTIFIAKHFLGESTALYIMFEYTSSHHAPGLCCILHFTYLMQSYPHSYHHPHPSHLVYISSLSFLWGNQPIFQIFRRSGIRSAYPSCRGLPRPVELLRDARPQGRDVAYGGNRCWVYFECPRKNVCNGWFADLVALLLHREADVISFSL